MNNKEKRISNFSELKFGLFAHYGLYSLLGKGEWALKSLNLDKAEYETLINRFTAEKFDAKKIISEAKNAGAKYFVLTTRHHDGFSLYDTKGINTYDAPHSACKRDLVYEFVDACAMYDVKPFFYHTMFDWYTGRGEMEMSEYLQYLRASVEVLCKNYGDVGGFWFDGTWSQTDDVWELDELYFMVRKYQPNTIITNNSGLDDRGSLINNDIDCVTFERGRPDKSIIDSYGTKIAGEMCEVIQSHWGFAKNDINSKSMPNLLESYLTSLKYGANFLLNVSPKGDGSLRLIDRAVLESFSTWHHVYGEALDHTRFYKNSSGSDHFCFINDAGEMFIFIFDLCSGGAVNLSLANEDKNKVRFAGIDKKITSMNWLDNGDAVRFEQENGDLTIYPNKFPYGTDLIVRIAKAKVN